MNDVTAIVLKPRISEKAYALTTIRNTYVFDVPSEVNKHTIKQAVEKQFKVTVLDVNVSVVKGKEKKSYRKRKQPVKGARRSVKKAYVVLKEGDSIPVFATAADEKEKK